MICCSLFCWSFAQTIENTKPTTIEPKKSDSIGNKIDNFFNKLIGSSSVYEINQYGTPRHVPRGKKPEVIIRNDTITVNGQPVYMFQSIDSWIRAFGSPSDDCKFEKNNSICGWLDYGLILSTDNSEGKTLVVNAIFYLNVPEYSYFFFPEKRDTNPYEKSKNNTKKSLAKPMQVFPGYIEINGYGLNAETKLWEVLKGAKSWEDPVNGNFGGDVGCHRDCHTAFGNVGEDTLIYIGVNGNSKTEKITEIEISTTHRLKINRPEAQSQSTKGKK